MPMALISMRLGGDDMIIERRLLERFVLDNLKSSSFNLVKDKATVDAHGVCLTVHSPEYLYKHIGT